ncbi:ABC transporter permease [Cytobacillus sp. FJAT-53684]|uniref:ABC transporter permease n=1 Tax=Cytobacillus mangrovibacter TaxID=3299024 RepID=A0ABW6K2B1_9BACI
MTLFSLAKSNIRGNFKSYLLYFLSMIFSVVIYYTFVSLQYSTEIQIGLESSQNLSSIFLQASIILILFVAVFILYSNSFFTRKRKREIGLYSLLGLRKKTIGIMLFYENLIMGAVSIVIGIIAGTFLSKLFSMILLKLMGSTIDVGMTVSIESIVSTIIVFGLIFLITSIRGYRLIYRFKLIELFQAEKEGEQIPKASVIAASCAIGILGVSYWLLLQPIISDTQYLINLTLITIGLVIGTYLLFRSVTVFLLRAVQKNKTHYFKGMNLIGTSQLLYRIKGNARTLTMISLLSAVTLSVISTAYSMYYFNEQRVNEFLPFSYVHLSQDEESNQMIESIIEGDKAHPVEGRLEVPIIEIETNFQIPGDDYLTNPVRLIAETTFNKAVNILNWKDEVKLSRNETAVIKPRLTEQTMANYKGHEITLKFAEEKRTFSFVDMKVGSILPWSYPDFYLIVNDEVFDEIAQLKAPIVYHAYKVEDHKTTEMTAKQLLSLETEQMYTYYKEYKEGLEMSGVNLFLLGFLGLVFLAATGSMIYFKQLTEAHSDIERYRVLRKIGVSKREVYSTIMKQSFFVLALPLVVGLVHSMMILEAVKKLYGASYYDLTVPMLTSMAAYVIIYLGYYVLTVKTYNNIVNK